MRMDRREDSVSDKYSLSGVCLINAQQNIQKIKNDESFVAKQKYNYNH